MIKPLRRFNKKLKRKGDFIMNGNYIIKHSKFTAILFFLFAFVLIGCSSVENTSTTVSVIEDVEQYSRISKEELIRIMGDPTSEEEWTNKTSKGDFLVLHCINYCE